MKINSTYVKKWYKGLRNTRERINCIKRCAEIERAMKNAS